jgi:O-methyltransferase involved in polyketide biosynthesis
MLQSFYARAQYSRKKNHKIYDAKAVEIVERIDYDFTSAGKDTYTGGKCENACHHPVAF